MKIKKQAEAILQEIKIKIGKERAEHVIREAMKDVENGADKCAKMLKLYEEKTAKATDKKPDFRSFLKQQKQIVAKNGESSNHSSHTSAASHDGA